MLSLVSQTFIMSLQPKNKTIFCFISIIRSTQNSQTRILYNSSQLYVSQLIPLLKQIQFLVILITYIIHPTDYQELQSSRHSAKFNKAYALNNFLSRTHKAICRNVPVFSTSANMSPIQWALITTSTARTETQS